MSSLYYHGSGAGFTPPWGYEAGVTVYSVLREFAPLPGWHGGGPVPAGGLPAVRRSVTSAFSGIRPQRPQTGERLPV